MQFFALFDRDFRSGEEIEAFLERIGSTTVECHVLAQKEIENYLLAPMPIYRALCERIRTRSEVREVPEYDEILAIIDHESDAFRSRVTAQMQAHRARFLRTKRDTRDDATIHAETLERISIEWTTLERRLRIVPGKDMLAALNRTLLQRFGQSVTEALLCSNFDISECDPDLDNLLLKLDMFCASGAEPASRV